MNCSFCGKYIDDVDLLVVGPTVSICDECIRVSNEILLEHKVRRAWQSTQEQAFLEIWGTDV